MKKNTADIEIRPEAAGDREAIATLTASAFKDRSYSSGTEQFIINALRRNGQLTISLVAVEAGVIVGHIAISPVAISTGASDWFGLGPLSVAPARQGSGIGSRLVEAAMAQLRRVAQGCIVLGNPAYYQRFGFKVYPHLVLPGVAGELFQAMPFAGGVPSGEVAFHDSFSAKQ